MWHASIAKPWPGMQTASRVDICALFDNHLLADVGQPETTWEEDRTPRAIHRRRLLTDAEWEKVGPLRDIRGTAEARRRVARLSVATGQTVEWLARQEPGVIDRLTV